MEGWKKMCLYKFTHIPLLKSDALLKNNNKKRPKKQSPKFIRKKIISRKKKKKNLVQRKHRNKKSQKKKKKEKKKATDWTSPCASAHEHSHEHFCHLFIKFLPLSFLSILERTFWWAQRENTSAPLFIFLPPHPTKHTPKKFSFPFFL